MTGSGRPLRILIVGDLHLRPTGEPFPVSNLPVEYHDLVLSIGDVVDENRDHAKSPEAGAAYEEVGREFFEYLDACGTPAVAVPGNHDPVTCTDRLTDGLGSIRTLHRAVHSLDAGDTAYHIVGWGCEEFDFPAALLTPEYPDVPLDSGTPATPDTVAQKLLQAAGQYLAGSLSRPDLAELLEIDTPDAEAYFRRSLTTLEDRFEEITSAVRDASSPVLIASHVSPFAVPFDRREPHAHDGEYHYGSLALRLALAETSPVACLSGHTHQQGFSVVETAKGHAYVYNPGSSGVASVTVDESGTVQVDEVSL